MFWRTKPHPREIREYFLAVRFHATDAQFKGMKNEEPVRSCDRSSMETDSLTFARGLPDACSHLYRELVGRPTVTHQPTGLVGLSLRTR